MSSLLSCVSYTVPEKSCLKNTRRKRIRLREIFKFDASDASRFRELKLHNTHFFQILTQCIHKLEALQNRRLFAV